MQCSNYISLLSGHIDGRNSEVEERRLQQHLQACKHCRALLEQMERTDAALHESKQEPPADLTARIMAQVRKEPKQKNSHKRAIFSIGAAGLAAAALLAFVFFGDLKLPELSSDENAPVITVYEQAEGRENAPAEVADKLFCAYADLSSDSFSEQLTEENSPYYGLTSTQQLPTTESLAPTEAVSSESAPAALSSDAANHLTLPAVSADTTESQVSTEGIGNGIPRRKPPMPASIETEAPLLVIWNAEPESFTLLKELTPLEEASKPDAPSTENTELTNEAAAESSSLYARLLAALPLAKKLSEMPPDLPSKPAPSITKYLVSYEQLSALFTECVGTYETAVYYPASVCNLDQCTVLVINNSEPAPTE